LFFAAWTGEEKGLYGSKYFVQQAQKNKMNVVLNLNYDMIARDEENDSLKNRAAMTYTKANGVIEEINCISKTIKPCCNKCSLINPNKKASVISTERKTGY